MKGKIVTIDNCMVGDKVALNPHGKIFMSVNYEKDLFDDIIYGEITEIDDYEVVVVNWYNHKGFNMIQHWYVRVNLLEYYEGS